MLACLLLHLNRGRFQLVITHNATIRLDHWQSCRDLLRVDLVDNGLLQLVKAVSVIKFKELLKEWASLSNDAPSNQISNLPEFQKQSKVATDSILMKVCNKLFSNLLN